MRLVERLVIIGGVMIVMLGAVVVYGFITLLILREPEGPDMGDRYSTGSGVGHQ
jgi:preprotein translocase subunit SecG